MIVRKAEHLRDYLTVSRFTLEDPELSLQAHGLLAFLLAKPDDWQVHVRQLATSVGISKNTACKIMAELELVGYVDKRRTRDETGRLAGFEFTVYEERQRPPGKGAPRPRNWDKAPRPKSRDVDHVPKSPSVVNLGHTNDPKTGDQVNKEHVCRTLAEELAAAVRKTTPMVACTPAAWEKDILQLIEKDGATQDQVAAVIKWLPSAPIGKNGFSWKRVVVSGEKLRQHFAKLLTQDGVHVKVKATKRKCPECGKILYTGTAAFCECDCGAAWDITRDGKLEPAGPRAKVDSCAELYSRIPRQASKGEHRAR